MGRMFGSRRFMVPEEFELGAPLDQRTTVFTLGRLVRHFTTHLTEDTGCFDGPAGFAAVVAQAGEPAPEDRFPTVAALPRPGTRRVITRNRGRVAARLGWGGCLRRHGRASAPGACWRRSAGECHILMLMTLISAESTGVPHRIPTDNPALHGTIWTDARMASRPVTRLYAGETG
jgi:hypothetical protein